MDWFTKTVMSLGGTLVVLMLAALAFAYGLVLMTGLDLRVKANQLFFILYTGTILTAALGAIGWVWIIVWRFS